MMGALVNFVQAAWPHTLLFIVVLFLFWLIDRADSKARKDGDK